MATNEQKFTQTRKTNVTGMKRMRSTTCLELEIECYTSVTQDCKVFVEPETAPLGTVPLT